MTFQPGGATLDTNSNNITLANAVGNGGPGGLTKRGVGTLTLAAQNTYTGGTTVYGIEDTLFGALAISDSANLGPAGNPLNLYNDGVLKYTGSAHLTLTNPLNPAGDFKGMFQVVNPAATLTIASNITGTSNIDDLGVQGPGILELTGDINVQGWLVIYGGTTNLHPAGAARQTVQTGGTNTGLYISGGMLNVGPGTDFYTNDGYELGAECVQSGQINVLGDAQFTIRGYNQGAPLTGSLLIGGDPADTGWNKYRAYLTASNAARINVGQDLIIGAFDDTNLGEVDIRDNANLFVQGTVIVGESNSAPVTNDRNCLNLDGSATMNAGELIVSDDFVLSNNQQSEVNITGNASVTLVAGRPNNLMNPSAPLTTGNLILNSNSESGVIAVLNVRDHASLIVGGTTTNNGAITLDTTGDVSLGTLVGTGSLTVGGANNMMLTFVDPFTLRTLTIAAGSQVWLTSIAASSFTKSGAGTLLLAGGDNSLSPTGALTIADGVFNLGGFSHTTRGTITFQGGTVQNGTIYKTGLSNYNGQAGTVSANLQGAVGLNKATAGTLVLSGNNTYTRATIISEGTLKAGSATALGTTDMGTLIENGATLNVNGFNLGGELITVQGSGVGGNGAIVNSGASQTNALRFVTLSGNTMFGGAGRWDMRGNGVAGNATLTGNGYDLTKVGSNSIYLVNLGDTDLGEIRVDGGNLGIQGTTTFVDGLTGDLAKPITVAAGASLTLWALPAANVINKKLTLQGGTLQTTSGAGVNNTYGGEITFDANGGILNVYSNTAITLTGDLTGAGGMTKNGAGTLIIKVMPDYSGDTVVNAGILQISTGGSPVLHNVTGAGTLAVGDGISATNLMADSINVGTLTIGVGSMAADAPISGESLVNCGPASSVPEPSTWAMLVLAALGLGLHAYRDADRRKTSFPGCL